MGGLPHTAYSAAKFAVKGFTEALITDLRLNASHIKCSVVMPGHIGTSIISNTLLVLNGTNQFTPEQLLWSRQRMKERGIAVDTMSDEQVQAVVQDRARAFRDEAPVTAAQAAKIILDAVKAGEWRILVGDGAHKLDSWVRREPEQAYTPEAFASFAKEAGLRQG